MILVRGCKTPNRREAGTILYAGEDGDEANKAIEENKDKYPRIEKSLAGIEQHFIAVQQYDAAHPAAQNESPASEDQIGQNRAIAKALARENESPASEPDPVLTQSDPTPKKKKK